MKDIIIINKEWYDKLVVILDELNKQIESEIIESMKNNNEFTFTGFDLGTYTTYTQDKNSFDLLKPTRIIYNDRATICYWKDGTKTVVKATKDDHMTHEHGVAMAIMRKLFPSRQEFLRVVNSGKESDIRNKK